jgi:Na+-translocating ferredoxin:NAD+ oxidoreductase RnfA subunit
MTVGFLASLALGVCVIVTVTVLWMLLGTVDPDLRPSLGWVLVITTGVTILEVVLVTALTTLGAFLYNLSAGLVGGVEMTLTQDGPE